jgi:hypothetical protein
VTLSKRERRIALATLLALAILGLDRIAITPVQERRSAAAADLAQTLEGLARARAQFDRQQQVASEWKHMQAAGLKAGPAEAESAVLHSLRDWSQETGLLLTSVRPDKTTDIGALREITFRASGEGGMNAVAGFLWRIETAALPVRLTELQIGSRKEGTDDLSLDVSISALCQGAGGKKVTAKKSTRPAPQQEQTDE